MNDRYLEYVKSNNYELLNNEFFSDFKIKVQGDELICHKCILYGGSEFFKAFFNFNQNQSDISLNEGIVTANGIKNCLIYIYSIGCDFILTEEKCEETYVAADFLQINALKSVASKSISGNISTFNAFGIIRFSATYNDTSLKMNARNFINNNFNKLSLDNNDFLSLSFDVLSEIVSDKNLSSTDYLILRAILTWTDYDADGRVDLIVENIHNLVQLHLISSEQWNTLLNEKYCSKLSEKITTMHSKASIYCDRPHRIGTPIVLYCVGSRRSDMLDWNNNFFCLDQTMDRLPPMVEDRTNHKVCASSTFIFVVGGECSDGFILKSCERFNLVEKKWEPMAELDCHRSNFAVAFLEGYVYLFGGYVVEDNTSHTTVSRDILVYDSGCDFWRKITYKTPCDMIDAVAVGHCSYIYVAGGLNDSDWPVNKITEFDPTNGDWTAMSTGGLPEEVFSAANIRSLSLTAGGWSQENDGFLLLSARVRNCPTIYVYHFSLNRWRLSIVFDGFPLEFLTYKKVSVSCERDFIGIVSPVNATILEQFRLQEPASGSREDELLLYLKFQISNDWSGELDLINHQLCKPFNVRPGYQFLLSPQVPD